MNFTVILLARFFSFLICSSIDNVCPSSGGSPLHTHHSLAVHQCFCVGVFKTPHSTHHVKNLGLVVVSLCEPCISSSYWSARNFLHNWTSITGFTEDHAQDRLYVASSSVTSFPVILLCCSLHWQKFWVVPIPPFYGYNYSVPTP
jgi:hypothetical protein